MKKLHIVSFNVPYPANYGGVIDVFYRIKALRNLGVDIELHTFQYGRPESKELQELCGNVHYYRRRTGILSAMSPRPYIVQSRRSSRLIDNLNKDDAPILLEGLHCCYLLEKIENRRFFVRAHNVEHDYYSSLAEVEHSLPRRLYLRSDARKLERYEPILRKADTILAVTENDAEHFRSIGCPKVLLMPSSHIDDSVVSKPSQLLSKDECYVLYHADLSVPENVESVLFLANNVFRNSTHRFVVAGRNPAPAVSEALCKLQNTKLYANPDETEMQSLIANSQVILMTTPMPTGLKLKLLNSLYAGRHCLVNSAMVAGTKLGELCTIADSAQDLRDALDRLMVTPFTTEDIERRQNLLGSLYSNQANARILLSLL
ncbi:MAG: glycosyltransferase family 1 protein [Bacteroidales bacterium]|nr:glycosyltransferase family 1 protein [Bacteroidales bacterium]